MGGKRKITLMLGAAVLAGAAAFRVRVSLSSASPSGPIRYPERVSLGALENGGNYEFSVPFENVGDSPVRLKNIRGSCGCFGVFTMLDGQRVEVSETILKAHQSAELIISLRAYSKTGEFAHQLTFESDYPEQPAGSVLLQGKVNHEILSYPESIHGGILAPGQKKPFVCFFLVSDKALPNNAEPKVVSQPAGVIVTKLEPSAQGLIEFLPPGFQLAKGFTPYRVQGTMCSEKPEDIQGNLEMRVGDEVASVSFFASVKPLFYTIPSVLILPRPGSPTPHRAKVLCQSQPSWKLSLGSNPKGLEAKLDGRILTITCKATEPPSNGTHVVQVLANTPEGTVHVAQVKVTVLHKQRNE